jgi:hypothetical protein
MGKKERPKIQRYCRECANAINPHNKSFATGKHILAECTVQKKDVLLNGEACSEWAAPKNTINTF